MCEMPSSASPSSPTVQRGFRRILLCSSILLVAFLLLNQTPCIPHLRQTHGPVPLEKAGSGCPIPLPASARNIQYRSFIFFQAYEDSVRSEAPVADCLAHADRVFKYWRERYRSDLYQEPGPLQPIDQPPQHPHLSAEIPWFDVENIRNGMNAGCRHPMQPTVWIDLDRGVFYYLLTD